MKFMRLTFPCFLLLVNVYGYLPPIGIPAPKFGIDDSMPARPSPWSSPIAGYYYVNFENGNDNGQTYGTPTAPRKTIPNPIPPGSYVEVHGTYKSNGNISIECNGNNSPWVANSSGPVWVVGQSWEERPSFSPSDEGTIFWGRYFNLRYLKFLNTSEGNLRVGNVWENQDADYAMVRECEIVGSTNSDGTGISIGGDPAHPRLRYSNIVIYKCEIHDIGNMKPSTDVDACGITVDDNTDSIWLLENHIYNIAEHASRTGGALIGQSNIDSTRFIYWGRNVVHHCLHSGFWVKYARDVIFSENIMHDINDSLYMYEGDATCIGAQYGPRRIWIINNRLFNSGGGVGIVSTDNFKNLPIYIIGNVIYGIRNPKVDYSNCYSYSGISVRGGTECSIVNNTIYRCGGGIYAAPFGGLSVVSNNNIDSIIVAKGKHLNIADNVNCLNNNVFQNNQNLRISVGGESYATVASFNASSLGDNCISLDPAYADKRTDNLSITEQSPLINKGTNAEIEKIFATFASTYGIALSKDFFGNSRRIGDVIDIGASEYGTIGIVSEKVQKYSIETVKKQRQFVVLSSSFTSPANLDNFAIYSLLGRRIHDFNKNMNNSGSGASFNRLNSACQPVIVKYLYSEK